MISVVSSAWIQVRRHGPPIFGVGLLSWVMIWGYRELALSWLVAPMVELWLRIQPDQRPALGLDPPPSLFLVWLSLATTFALLTTLPMLIALVWAIVRPASFAAVQGSLWRFRLISYVALALAVWYLRTALVPQAFVYWSAAATGPIHVSPMLVLKEYVGFAVIRLVVYALAALFGIVSMFVGRTRRGEDRRWSDGLLPLGVVGLAFVIVSAVLVPMEGGLQARWILPMAGLYVLCLTATRLLR